MQLKCARLFFIIRSYSIIYDLINGEKNGKDGLFMVLLSQMVVSGVAQEDIPVPEWLNDLNPADYVLINSDLPSDLKVISYQNVSLVSGKHLISTLEAGGEIGSLRSESSMLAPGLVGTLDLSVFDEGSNGTENVVLVAGYRKRGMTFLTEG